MPKTNIVRSDLRCNSNKLLFFYNIVLFVFFFLLVVVCVQDGNLCYINRIIEFEALQNEIQEENNFVCVFNANFCSTKRKWKDSTLCKRERGTNYLAIKFSSLNNAQHSFLSLWLCFTLSLSLTVTFNRKSLRTLPSSYNW